MARGKQTQLMSSFAVAVLLGAVAPTGGNPDPLLPRTSADLLDGQGEFMRTGLDVLIDD